MNERAPHLPGFFGKLRSKRDFVNRRVPMEFLQTWDCWLQASMTESRQQLGEEWLDVYLESPIWRFCLSAGVAGQRAWAGILMPSVDGVGRYYPLTLTAPLPRGTGLFKVLSDGSSWFEATEKLALWSLEEDFDIEAFDERVSQLGLPTGAGDSSSLTVEDEDENDGRANAWRIEFPSTRRLHPVCPSLLDHTLKRLFCGYSLWWTAGSPRISPSLLVCQALPPADGFSALLGGSWKRGHWLEFAPGAHEDTPTGELGA